MCGIVGTYNINSASPISEAELRQMLALVRHRGPDQFGIYLDEQVGLGSARLSIIDLSGGQQPITNEDGSLWIVYNGEVFNYPELRSELEARGHRFSTNTDTEVILHLYEDLGPRCLERLNGQFAIAIWDKHARTLFLGRDRLGVRPLFYTNTGEQLVFGSEIKAIMASRLVQAELDPLALDQIFTYWSTLSPRTAFKNILEVPPGHFMLASSAEIRIEPYWQLVFPDASQYPDDVGLVSQGVSPSILHKKADEYLEEFYSLLVDATQIRLRADVPVGAYLSGGLDSSTIAAVIRSHTQNRLDTFSIAFSDPDFDESPFQRQMAAFLGTDHQVVYTRHSDIGRVFPEVIWHTETPILRTSPAPMFLLSELVRANNFKVVLTGEGADEFLGGYDIFKEAKIRAFWSKQPKSKLRPLLLQRLYPEIVDLPNSSQYLASFFGAGLDEAGSPGFSHHIRWKNTNRTKRFFSTGLVDAIGEQTRIADQGVYYPSGFSNWHPLSQAQYLESTIFLSQYLLSSQGDRPAMAHSVEGRFPFLDYRIVEFCCQLPPHLKLMGLTEKYLLKRLASRWLPDEISKRRKRPYRAPIHRSFFNEETQPYVYALLSPEWINRSGLFNPVMVGGMVQKVKNGGRLSETDDMALAGILSAQLVQQQFVDDFHMPPPIGENEDIKVCMGAIGELR
jgi:asparagine synthase (glutamine-hydrolysing)